MIIRNKYRNKRMKCKQGHTHASMLEADYCNQLYLLKKAGEIRDYNSQVSFRLDVAGKLICRHIVDFLVINNKGIAEVHETKGMITRDFKIKRKLFEALYPHIKYYVIGDRKRRIMKYAKSKMF